MRWWLGLVHGSPLLAKLVRLVFPCHEANGFHDSRLDNFLARENTPCHGIRSVRVGIGAEIALFVDYIVSDVWITFDVGNEQVEEARTDEKFEVCLKLEY